MLALLQRILSILTGEDRRTRRILEAILVVEEEVMTLRDDFDAALAELTAAIQALADRIAGLPTSVGDLTQADVDGLKADSAALAALAPGTPTP